MGLLLALLSVSQHVAFGVCTSVGSVSEREIAGPSVPVSSFLVSFDLFFIVVSPAETSGSGV